LAESSPGARTRREGGGGTRWWGQSTLVPQEPAKSHGRSKKKGERERQACVTGLAGRKIGGVRKRFMLLAEGARGDLF